MDMADAFNSEIYVPTITSLEGIDIVLQVKYELWCVSFSMNKDNSFLLLCSNWDSSPMPNVNAPCRYCNKLAWNNVLPLVSRSYWWSLKWPGRMRIRLKSLSIPCYPYRFTRIYIKREGIAWLCNHVQILPPSIYYVDVYLHNFMQHLLGDEWWKSGNTNTHTERSYDHPSWLSCCPADINGW